MALIGWRDLQDYLGRDLLGAEVAAFDQLADDCQAELEAWLGRTLEVASHTETLTVYSTDSFIELSYTPVVSVTSIVIDGSAWTTGTWGLERSGIRLITSASVLTSFSTVDTVSAVVTYTAGLGAPATAAARRILKARIGRILDKRLSDELGLRRLTIDRYSTDWLPEEFFTDEELRAVTRWKRRIVSTEPSMPLASSPSWTGWI